MGAPPRLDHPALVGPGSGLVRTRLGISPNHPSLRAGVLRTHLLTALFAYAVAERTGASAHVHVRWDDTDPSRARRCHEPRLLDELRNVAQIPVSDAGLRQSDGAQRYLRALGRLQELGVIRDQDGAACLDIAAADRLLRRRGQEPEAATAEAAVNTRVQREPVEARVRLFRSDGRALWHLASVVDDIHRHTTLIVRGSDKINATAIQVRLFLLLGAPAPPAFLFVPRLLETDRDGTRTAALLDGGVRPSALRWYLAEPFLAPASGPGPQSFADLVTRLRADVRLRADARFDQRRLAALDRKLSGALPSSVACDELIRAGATAEPELLAWVAAHYRRPLPQQSRLCALLEYKPAYGEPPQRAAEAVAWLERHLRGGAEAPAPPALAWVLTGETDLPGLGPGVERLPAGLVRARLTAARQALRRASAASMR
ncbi:hypothetical protein [Streptomonospora salina]|uniref:Glutamyl/glutaminyl-tRNA synthetase n=1 Tax=Streptomonospora salina TaxID=104205 RepID=A0A841E8J7_9ACTN|nr:hypothetical protein [Streptomonospora salina]MBB5998804.1 glutamyl/glutaminyl-tRNA synthetase [Streptomonospora salina]